MSSSAQASDRSLVYRSQRSQTGDRPSDESAGHDATRQPRGRSSATQQRQGPGRDRGQTPPGRDGVGAGVGGPDGPAQQSAGGPRSDPDFGHSPFESGGRQDGGPPRHTGQAGADEQPTTGRSDSGGRGIDDIGAQLGEQSLQLNADVDRLVDVLYRKLERKRRVERQRRGF